MMNASVKIGNPWVVYGETTRWEHWDIAAAPLPLSGRPRSEQGCERFDQGRRPRKSCLAARAEQRAGEAAAAKYISEARGLGELPSPFPLLSVVPPCKPSFLNEGVSQKGGFGGTSRPGETEIRHSSGRRPSKNRPRAGAVENSGFVKRHVFGIFCGKCDISAFAKAT